MKPANCTNLSWVLLALLVGCGDRGSSAGPSSEGAVDSSSAQDSAQDPVRSVVFTISGRTIDPWSDPVARATIEVLSIASEGAASEGTAPDTAPAVSTTSAEDGAFRLEVPRAGRWTIVARDSALGVARREASLDAAHSTLELGDLRLQGEGVLAGELLARDGSPIADIDVVAFSRDLLRQELFFGVQDFDLDALPLWAPDTPGAHFEAGQGFHKVTVTTRADGSFRLEGLAPGSYLLYSTVLGNAAWLDPARRWYTTGEENLELRTQLCRVEILIPGDREGAGPDKRRSGRVELFPTVPTTDGDVAALLAHSLGAPGVGHNVFWVEPGTYVVKAMTFPARGVAGESRTDEDVVRVGADSARLEHRLPALLADPPSGRLRVSVRVPAELTPPAGYRLLSGWTATAVQRLGQGGRPDALFGDWVELPEGRHVVRLTPRVDLAGLPGARELAEASVQVRVEAGRDTEAELVLAHGGRLVVALDAERFVLDRDLLLPDGLLDGERRQVLSSMAMTVGATLALQRDGAGPLSRVRWRDPLARLGEERQLVLPGETVETFELLAPGDYTLWVLRPGSKRARLPLTIRSDETREVEVKLETR